MVVFTSRGMECPVLPW